MVANAQHVKKAPGRRTDVKDAEWIADLLCHGLLRSSFVPPKPIRELRDLTRYGRNLVESQVAERNLEPALEGQLQEHHRFLLRLQLERLEAAEKDLAALEIWFIAPFKGDTTTAQIAARVRFRAFATRRLCWLRERQEREQGAKRKAQTGAVPDDKSSQVTVLDPYGNPQLVIRRHF